MTGMRFEPNRQAARDLARAADMGHALGRIAGEAADEIERRLPHPDILGGIRVEADTDTTGDGVEGVVRVIGPGWHLWEYGTVNHRPQPAIRPGMQATISRHGGRWTPD